MSTFAIYAVESDEDGTDTFKVGEAYELLEAQFLAREEFDANAAALTVYVMVRGDITYVIDRFNGSGSVARTDGRPVKSWREAVSLL